MLLTTTGLIKNGFYVTGLSSYPVHLLDAAKPVLFDAGMTAAGKMYRDDIRSVLGERQPEILFISHVHWDHCGATTYLKRAFPSLKIAASENAARIMSRPRAVELMARLSENARSIVASFPEIESSQLIKEPFEPFEIDMLLEDGQTIDLGDGLTVEVLATPGHTRDHLSFFVPREEILITGEASGCLDSAGSVITQFLFDYDAYIRSLNRLAALPASVLCQGHRIVFVGRDEVRDFFARSIEEAARFKDRVEELLRMEAGSIDRVIGRIKAEQYDVNKGIKQPEGPYLLNLRAQVTHLAERAGRPQ
jgi:2-aminobenzoylacetyl-CoA thioesterase